MVARVSSPAFSERRDVALVEGNDLSLSGHALTVLNQLLPDPLILGCRVVQRAIHDMHQDPRPLDVPEEFMPEADTRMRALDQARYIDEHGPLLPKLDDAQDRLERRERVRSYLGTSRSEGREEAGLTGVWLTYDTDVSDELEI